MNQYQFLKSYPDSESSFKKLVQFLNDAKRPIAIAGWGIHLSKSEKAFLKFIKFFHLPTALTWGGSDLLEKNHELFVGTFGTHGMRHANFSVQNADLIISFGSRLDTKSTGSPINTFARGAKKIMIDIDPNELGKFKNFSLDFDLLIQDDLNNFFKVFFNYLKNNNEGEFYKKKYKDWLKKIEFWKTELSKDDLNKNQTFSNVDPYYFFKKLSDELDSETLIFIDTGCSIAWAMQVMSFGEGQRVFHDFNNTAMGWALPGAIGGHFANKDQNIICIVGDGSFMMSLQELATAMHHKINLKLIIVNNSGYSMIKQTQEQWLNSDYVASSKEGGISFPSNKKIAESFDLDYFLFEDDKKDQKVLENFLNNDKASLLELIISPDARVIPQVKFGRPNEDMEPLLPRNIFRENMIIKPIENDNI